MIKTRQSQLKEICLKMPSAKWRPFYSDISYCLLVFSAKYLDQLNKAMYSGKKEYKTYMNFYCMVTKGLSLYTYIVSYNAIAISDPILLDEQVSKQI